MYFIKMKPTEILAVESQVALAPGWKQVEGFNPLYLYLDLSYEVL